MYSLKILVLHESLALMEKCGIQNRILLSFLLILIISNSLASECRKAEPGETHQSKDICGSSACEEVRVGLVLDMGSMDGKVVQSSITMALSDFYRINRGYRTRVSVLTRDSLGEPLLALAAAVDLLQTAEVEAIIGAQSLIEAKFLAELAEKAKVPMISLHVPSSLTLRKYNHFIQATHDETSEAKGITAFIHSFDWDSVVLIYEDDDDWRESMQLLMEHFRENGIHIVQKRAFLVSFGEDYIMEQLQMFKEIEAMVFIVHVSEKLASYLFPCAGRLGMMEEGYAWILTAKSMNHLHYTGHFVKESMEGVVGFRPHISMSKELYSFTSRWRISLPIEEVGVEIKELSIFGIWAHDIAWVLAKAAEIARLRGPKTHHLGSANAKVSSNVSALLDAITQSRFKGLSGDILFIDKNFFSDTFEIVNIIGTGERRLGFWASGWFSNIRHLSSTNELGTIIWPGGSATTPNGRSLRESGKKKLRVLVTSSNRFPQLMDVYNDSKTGRINATGFCIDVFLTSIAPFNYEPEYIPWHGGSNYDDLAYAVYSQKDKYDAAVGDITITANRSSYVDFTLPYSDMGLGVVAAKDKSLWIFLEPLTPHLWLTSAFFFAFTGIVVWLIERPVNAEFQGSWSQQVGVILWFGFSTLVYAHKERLQSNLSRFVVIVWVFAVLILISNYTATLTSVMTVQHMQFKSNQNYIGYLYGSSVAGLVLNSSNFRATRPKGLNKSEDFAKALLSGNVSFIIDEVPYLKVLLGDHLSDFDMVKTEIITNGFGFMFQKGSPLVWKVSKEIAKLRTTGRLTHIENRWFLKQPSYINADKCDPLTVYKFRGLFMITGVSWAIALTTLLIHWLREKRPVLKKLFDLLVNHRQGSFRNLMARTVHPASRTIADTPSRETANEIQMVRPN